MKRYVSLFICLFLLCGVVGWLSNIDFDSGGGGGAPSKGTEEPTEESSTHTEPDTDTETEPPVQYMELPAGAYCLMESDPMGGWYEPFSVDLNFKLLSSDQAFTKMTYPEITNDTVVFENGDETFEYKFIMYDYLDFTPGDMILLESPQTVPAAFGDWFLAYFDAFVKLEPGVYRFDDSGTVDWGNTPTGRFEFLVNGLVGYEYDHFVSIDGTELQLGLPAGFIFYNDSWFEDDRFYIAADDLSEFRIEVLSDTAYVHPDFYNWFIKHFYVETEELVLDMRYQLRTDVTPSLPEFSIWEELTFTVLHYGSEKIFVEIGYTAGEDSLYFCDEEGYLKRVIFADLVAAPDDYIINVLSAEWVSAEFDEWFDNNFQSLPY